MLFWPSGGDILGAVAELHLAAHVVDQVVAACGTGPKKLLHPASAPALLGLLDRGPRFGAELVDLVLRGRIALAHLDDLVLEQRAVQQLVALDRAGVGGPSTSSVMVVWLKAATTLVMIRRTRGEQA
jgi:hypothetical protein